MAAQLAPGEEPWVELAQSQRRGQLRQRRPDVQLAVRLFRARPEAAAMAFERGQRACRAQPDLEQCRHGDRPLIVARKIRVRTAPEPLRVEHQTAEQRRARRFQSGVAQPEILGGSIGRRPGAELGAADRAEKVSDGMRPFRDAHHDPHLVWRIHRDRARPGGLERSILLLDGDGPPCAEIEAQHSGPAPHGPKELAERERARAPRNVDEPEQVVPLRASRRRARAGLAFQEPAAKVARHPVGCAEEPLASVRHGVDVGVHRSGVLDQGRTGLRHCLWRRCFLLRSRGRPAARVQLERGVERVSCVELREGRLCRFPRRGTRRGSFPLRLRQCAFHVGALFALAQSRQVPIRHHRRESTVEARVAVQAYRRAPGKLQQLLRRAGIQRERTRTDEEITEGSEARRPARAGCALESLHRLCEPVAGARQPVEADDLGEKLREGSAARDGKIDPGAIRAERRGVLPQIDELAQRHGRKWIPLPAMPRLLAVGFVFATTFCGACKEKPPPPVLQSGTPGRIGTATIRGMVKFRGTIPAAPRIGRGSFAECAKTASRAAAVLVYPDGGVAEAFVWVKEGVPDGDYPIPADPVVIDQRGCEFLPRVAGVRAGQPVAFRNDDQTLHNVHAIGTGSNRFNFGMPVTGMEVKRLLAEPQVMVTVACDVHPWMRAYLGVVRHPFFAVTGADGHFAITGLPGGTYVLEAWQEATGRVEHSVTLRDGESVDTDLVLGN